MDTGPTTTLSVVTLPAVTLLVVMPAVPIVVLPPIVAESKLTFFLVATVIFFLLLESCLISMLSPSTKSTVSPLDTAVVSAVEELVVTFQVAPAAARLAAALIASATFLAVANPSAPVTEAWPVVGLLVMVARLVAISTADPFILVEI